MWVSKEKKSREPLSRAATILEEKSGCWGPGTVATGQVTSAGRTGTDGRTIAKRRAQVLGNMLKPGDPS